MFSRKSALASSARGTGLLVNILLPRESQAQDFFLSSPLFARLLPRSVFPSPPGVFQLVSESESTRLGSLVGIFFFLLRFRIEDEDIARGSETARWVDELTGLPPGGTRLRRPII
jgi:hypothetical protein